MSVGCMSFTNDSILQPNISSIDAEYPLDLLCFISGPSSFMVTAYFIIFIILLLPFCIVILHHGFQQWQQKRSSSSGAKMSHSDCFTYHLVTMQLICVFSCFINCIAIHSNSYNLFLMGYYLAAFSWFGEVGLHVLTCVERYLAVVHPITYLKMRTDRGVRLRNITIFCVWLLSVVWTGLIMEDFYNVLNFFFLTLCLTIVIFCSLSVLCVLIKSGPGKQEGGIKRVNQSKLRALYTIISIVVVLMVWFAWGLVWAILYQSNQSLNCLIMTADLWFNLPCSVTLPLLFLHKKGKLLCCKKEDQ